MTPFVYLAVGAIATALGLVALWLFPALRRAMLVSGLLAAPGGLTDVWFVPEYWSPPHLIGKDFSIEGVLFSFGHGLLLMFVALVPFGRRVRMDLNGRRVARRYVGCIALASCVFALLWTRGPVAGPLPIMDAALVALAVTGAYIVWRRPDAWPLMISGALGFGVLYAVELLLAAQIVPGYALYWSAAARAGPTFAGFPIEELWWGLIYGGVWALSAAYGADIRLGPARGEASVRAQ